MGGGGGGGKVPQQNSEKTVIPQKVHRKQL